MPFDNFIDVDDIHGIIFTFNSFERHSRRFMCYTVQYIHTYIHIVLYVPTVLRIFSNNERLYSNEYPF